MSRYIEVYTGIIALGRHIYDQANSESWHSQKSLLKHFLGYLRDIQGYWCIFSHTYRRSTRRGVGEASLAVFENRKKCPDFGKKSPDFVHLRIKFSIQNVIFSIKGKKIHNVSLRGFFFWGGGEGV